MSETTEPGTSRGEREMGNKPLCPGSETFGLPIEFITPIAALTRDDVEKYVGKAREIEVKSPYLAGPALVIEAPMFPDYLGMGPQVWVHPRD